MFLLRVSLVPFSEKLRPIHFTALSTIQLVDANLDVMTKAFELR
jgi:hypothetical protein